jgi:nucleoside-diphosphate-sugar epimerase
VLRPPLVYGPGVKGNFLRFLHWIARGRPVPLASVRGQRSLIYLGNLVEATCLALASPQAAGQTFLLRDGEDVSVPDLLRKLAAALDVKARLIPCPQSLLMLAATLAGKREDALRLTGSLQVDDSKIRGTLGWRPPFSLEEGLARTAGWFLELEKSD